MPEKLRKRVHFYSSFDELKIIDGKKLPVECGGETPIEKFIGEKIYHKKANK
jgi:hypothetical protein